MAWRPAPRTDIDLQSLPLDARQGFLLSRLDGASDAATLAKLTGIAVPEIESMLHQLVTLGAIEPESARTEDLFAPLDSSPAPAKSEDASDDTGRSTGLASLDDSPDEPREDPESDGSGEADDDTADDPVTHRALFERTLHHLSTDERTARARSADEPELSAFCFDAMPQVIQALFENPRAGLSHARLVAAHHTHAVGLETMASRAAFAADAGVRRALLKNPLLPSGLFRRLWAPRRLTEQYQVAASHEVTDQTRSAAKEVLRASFASRPGDERAELILKTEGRCLVFLVGLTLDGKATALLCRRTYVSTLLIQNLARWSATPPPLIAHLRRQEIVRRTPPLRMMLERHPNAA